MNGAPLLLNLSAIVVFVASPNSLAESAKLEQGFIHGGYVFRADKMRNQHSQYRIHIDRRSLKRDERGTAEAAEYVVREGYLPEPYRWRISHGCFWGTGDWVELAAGLKHIPVEQLPLFAPKTAKESDQHRPEHTWYITDPLEQTVLAKQPGPGVYGSWHAQGAYFDFLPITKDSILLFILDENRMRVWEGKSKRKTVTVELEKSSAKIEEWVFGWSELLGAVIACPFSESFVVFGDARTHYFVTVSGKLFVAKESQKETEKPETTRRLIRELGDDDSAVREVARRKLERLGSQVETALRKQLRETTSGEAKGRISKLLSVVEKATDRTAKPLWIDAKRPIRAVITDTASSSSYAFVEPAKPDDKQAQRVYFQLAEKLEPHSYHPKPIKGIKADEPLKAVLEYARVLLDDGKIKNK